MASAHKKVVIRRFDHGVAWGYLQQEAFVRDDRVDVMGINGKLSPIDMNNIKLIAYVRDFNLNDTENPERLGRKTFLGRPRGDGIWLRAGFIDGDILEGLADLGLGFLDTACRDRGLFLTPPDTRANTLRVFLPRASLRSLEVLGWITAPSKRTAAKQPKKTTDETQPRLFE